jgi:hypothetical protein
VGIVTNRWLAGFAKKMDLVLGHQLLIREVVLRRLYIELVNLEGVHGRYEFQAAHLDHAVLVEGQV